MDKPKYALIVDDLISKIGNSLFLRGDKFYSEAEIKKLYNVSSTTAVKVLNELASRDIIVRIQGKGSFISKSDKNELVRLSNIERFPGEIVKVRVISITEDNDKNILKKLGLKSKETYFVFVRTREIKNIVTEAFISYIPSNLVKKDLISKKENFTSIYNRLREDFQINPYQLAYKEIDSIGYIEDPQILQLLHLNSRALLLIQKRTTTDKVHNREVEYITSFELPEYFKQQITREP
ncbi:GntR family transcriptional regulator [Pediococcus cellicola]|nr:GntR family transcriptional regulator [Pediococcus cellicola]GEL15874.1 GntR family transcriptional regulator [Pediococcus cellicola]